MHYWNGTRHKKAAQIASFLVHVCLKKRKLDSKPARLNNKDVVYENSLKSSSKHITIASESKIANDKMTHNREKWQKAAPTALYSVHD